jgi:hypothetical protein
MGVVVRPCDPQWDNGGPYVLSFHTIMIASSARTLCRLENRIERKTLVWIAEVLVDQFITSHTHTTESLIFAFGTTGDRLHGQQEGRFFHCCCDNYCYMPVYASCGDELVAPYLSPSKSDTNKHSGALLERLIRWLHESWPDVKIPIPCDSGFCIWKLIRRCDSHGIAYVRGLRRNHALERLGADWIERADRRFAKTGQPPWIFDSFAYQASSWHRPRRVIVKAEHTAQASNVMSVAPELFGFAPAQRTFGLWWQRLAAICCAVAPPRGNHAGSFRGSLACGAPALRSPGSGWRHAPGHSANGWNFFSGSPTSTSFSPGNAHRAFARRFSPAAHISPESAQRRNIRLKSFSARSLDCCAGDLRPSVRRNTRQDRSRSPPQWGWARRREGTHACPEHGSVRAPAARFARDTRPDRNFDRNATPMTTALTEHNQPPPPDRRPILSSLRGVRTMNENERSSDRDRIATDPMLAWFLAAEDDQDFVHRFFPNYEAWLDELDARITTVLEDGRLDAGRRQALCDRIAILIGRLVELADAVEPLSGNESLPPLEGSTKQVAWAEQLRAALIHEVERAGDRDLGDRIRAVPSASWFIAARDHPLDTLRDSLGM